MTYMDTFSCRSVSSSRFNETVHPHHSWRDPDLGPGLCPRTLRTALGATGDTYRDLPDGIYIENSKASCCQLPTRFTGQGSRQTRTLLVVQKRQSPTPNDACRVQVRVAAGRTGPTGVSGIDREHPAHLSRDGSVAHSGS